MPESKLSEPVRMLVAGVVFLLFAGGVLFAGHFYLIQRLVLEAELDSGLRSMLTFLMAGFGATVLLAPIAERTLRPPLARWVLWPAGIWMGVLFFLILLVPLTDFLLFITRVEVDATVARQRALVVAGITSVACIAATLEGLRPPRLVRHEIELSRWPKSLDGFRIVQITDIHIGPLLDRRFAEALTERCNALAPDLLAVTGDLVDGGIQQLYHEVTPFERLRARHGVFFVTGNHDHYSGARNWTDRSRELGMRVLRNERVWIGDAGARFELAGVDDHRSGAVDGSGEDLDLALADRDHTVPLVLLAHDPSTFKRASQRGIDFQISGHTHGGQIWPFRYFVRLAVPFVAGHYEQRGARLYVSRGTGFWGPPMRLFSPAEITEFTLRSTDA